MTPAPSLCGITLGYGIPEPTQSPRFFVSPGLIPETATRTRTSPGPGSGAAISPTARTSAAGPGRSYQAANTRHHATAPHRHSPRAVASRLAVWIRWSVSSDAEEIVPTGGELT